MKQQSIYSTTNEVINFITNALSTCICAIGTPQERDKTFTASYNHDLKLFVVKYDSKVELDAVFFNAVREVLFRAGINVNYVFIKETKLPDFGDKKLSKDIFNSGFVF